MRRGVDGAAQILEAAGARQDLLLALAAGSPTSRAGSGSRAQFMREADACGCGAGRCTYGSFHIMGSARMGGSPDDLRLQPDGRDMGRARPLRLRRLRVPDRLGREPDDLDRGDRPHERIGARSSAHVSRYFLF